MVCDNCGSILQPGTEFCAFIFTGYAMKNSQMVPTIRQEEFCNECTGKIITLMDNLKNETKTPK